MIDITFYKNQLRQLFPTAVIKVEIDVKSIKWELKITPAISEKEHEEAFPKIKEIFGGTLIERYTETTGHHFYIYQRHTNSQDN